ncbi:hypothetical protein PG999_014317, partial [Apiospora kogelbergensis]
GPGDGVQDQQDLQTSRAKLQEAEEAATAGQAQLDKAKSANVTETRRLAKTSKDLANRSDHHHKREQKQERNVRDANISFEKDKAALTEHRFTHAQHQKSHTLAIEKTDLGSERLNLQVLQTALGIAKQEPDTLVKGATALRIDLEVARVKFLGTVETMQANLKTAESKLVTQRKDLEELYARSSE